METAGGPQPTFPPPPPTTSTTTTLPGGSTTTSTLPGGSTSTTTLPPPATEICGNRVDDDGNGDVDYDDAACCTASGSLQLKEAQLKPGAAGGKLKVTAQLGGAGFPTIDPTAADLFVRLASGDGTTILCGRIPGASVKRKKKGFQFAD